MIPKLQKRDDLAQTEKLTQEFDSMQKLIDALNEKAIPAGIADSISQQLAPLNHPAIPAPQYTKMLADRRKSILKQVEKELKLVPQKHYLKTWMALGMSAFGLPFGVAFSMMLKN